MMDLLAPLVVGLAFGWLLESGGLTRPGAIVGVYRATDWTVLKFLGAAVVAGAIAVEGARSLGLVATLAVTPTALAAQALGGALLGAGMAAAGFCPGTIAAGAGTGRLDALVPGMAGLLAGALLHAWRPPTVAGGALGPTTIPSLLGVSPWLAIVVLSEAALLGFYVVERHAGARARRITPSPGPRFATRDG